MTKTRNNLMKYFMAVMITIYSIGCVSVNTKMNSTLNDIYPGMTIQDFKEKVRGETLVEMQYNFACYKLEKQSAKFGEPGGYVYTTRFFYFKDNKLYRIDEGTRATDLKIEIEKDIHKN